MSGQRAMIVIPARMHSTRLPRKMLLDRTGKPLIQHTWEAACRATVPEKVIVATDHPEIAKVVREFGGEVRLTDPEAPSGTDRVAEVSADFPEFELVANVQGDEPEIEPQAIDLALETLHQDPHANLSTLATPIREMETLMNPSCVKVVFDAGYNALYFSRSPIPCARDGFEKYLHSDPPRFFLHVGLYCYRREFLHKIRSIPVSLLERTESLEQLRFLENGYRIKTAVIERSAPGIDTAEDYEAFVKRCRN